MAQVEQQSDPPGWLDYFTWLAKELEEEAERRLDRLHKAGREWQRRAKEATTEAGRGTLKKE
jgi:hypothetical protein